MLEKIVIVSQFVSLLVSHQPSLPTSEHYVLQAQKPSAVIHSYGNENLNSILKEAESFATSRPHYAIALYRRVMVESGPLADKAVEGAMEIYNKKLKGLPLKEYDKWEVENALSFFDEVIQRHPKYTAEAYLKSGQILCDLLFQIPERIPEAMKRFEEAYKRGDILIKAKARFEQGWAENLIADLLHTFEEAKNYGEIIKYGNKDRAKRYLREVMKLTPKSEEAKKARNLLEVLGVIETK